MTKLEKLYNIIENSRDVGVKLLFVRRSMYCNASALFKKPNFLLPYKKHANLRVFLMLFPH